MQLGNIKALTALGCLYLSIVAKASPDDKAAKHFSLFSVVQFDNEECTTDGTPAGGATQGTCYTSTECTSKGGVSAGRCAAGFGVCCAFLNIAAANSVIMQNRTRLRNPEFPMISATAAQTIAYTINKFQTDICQIRLDFATFAIVGPANSDEIIGTADPQTTATHCTVDTLTIGTTDVPNVASTGTFCGALTGEHLYVELSPTATDSAIITLTTAAAAVITTQVASRSWDIKVSQIECHATWRAPPGCNRYLTTDAGKIISLNFLQTNPGTPPITQAAGVLMTTTNSGLELANQRINTCIRRSKGMCCVEYLVCTSFGGIALADGTNVGAGGDGTGNGGNAQFINAGWSLDKNTAPFVVQAAMLNDVNLGMVDSQCSGDYVEIPSSWSGGCGSGHGSARNTINSRYCGSKFGANFGASIDGTAANWNNAANAITASTPVCDCSEPFKVRHNSDSVNDIGGIAAAAINMAHPGSAVGRGFCLDYRQTPCWQ